MTDSNPLYVGLQYQTLKYPRPLYLGRGRHTMSEITTDDLAPGDTIRDAQDGCVLSYNYAASEVKFDVVEDGDTVAYRSEDVGSVDERLSDGRYEPESVAALQPDIDDLVPGVGADEDVYIRFGDVPEDERSRDSRNDRDEDGVSVYATELEDGVIHPTGNMLQTVFALLHRDTYLATGEQVGTGADGEPLLRDVEIVCELTSPEGCAGFVPAETDE